jgi:DNA end-binding protein Ku
MRPVWTGSIGFGLVNIPVRLYTAVQSSTLDLDMLDSHDHSNIKFKRVNENTGKEVPYKNIVKGYLYHDQYVVIEPKDFELADAKKTKVIEIQNFVEDESIDSIYYEQPYYIEPDKNGERAYAILRDALKASKKVGVSTFVLRNKEALAVIKPYGKVLVLNRLRFDEEVRSPKDLNLPDVTKAKPKEQLMAKQLIDQLSEKFDISAYKDTYTDKLLKIIKAKAQGKKPKVQKMKIVHTKSDDLMGMLKASLEKKKKAS